MRFSVLIVTVFTMLYSHFLSIIPDADFVDKSKHIRLDISFIHPFSMQKMQISPPLNIGVSTLNRTFSLKKYLKKSEDSYVMTYDIKRPSDYIFFTEQEPYFEESEAIFIKHYAKVVVNAMGKEDSWSKLVGLEFEIKPLTKPYGLYKGSIFSGVALFKGKVVKNAKIEVELLNKKGVKAPSLGHITQKIISDQNGVFHVSFPFSGWWGINALLEDGMMKHNNRSYPIEKGATIWVKVY